MVDPFIFVSLSKFFVRTHADSNRTVPEYENAPPYLSDAQAKACEASVPGGNTNKTRTMQGRARAVDCIRQLA
jgi:hypothetical protein